MSDPIPGHTASQDQAAAGCAHSYLRDLLRDAEHLSAFTLRAGKDCGDLHRAFVSARGLPELTWASPQTLELLVQVEKALGRCEPETLERLSAGWNPFGQESQSSRRTWVKMGLVAVAVAMCLTTAMITDGYVRLRGAIADLQQAEAAYRDVIDSSDVLNLLANESDIDPAEPDPVKPGAVSSRVLNRDFDRSLVEIRRVDAQWQQAFTKVYSLNAGFSFWSPFTGSALDVLGRGKRAEGVASAKAAKETGYYASAPDPCATDRIEAPRFQPSVATVRLKCNLRLSLDRLNGSTVLVTTTVGQAEDRANALPRVWLPMLYGAFGALIYYLRRMIDPLRPDPRLVRMVFRTVLGGFAGITVSWLAEPFIDDHGVISALGFSILPLALVCGFSVDVFFALLERLVVLARRAIDGIGEPQPSTPASLRP